MFITVLTNVNNSSLLYPYCKVLPQCLSIPYIFALTSIELEIGQIITLINKKSITIAEKYVMLNSNSIFTTVNQ